MKTLSKALDLYSSLPWFRIAMTVHALGFLIFHN